MQDPVLTGIALGCIAAGAAALCLASRSRLGTPQQVLPAALPLPSTALRPANQLPILTGAELLLRTGSAGLLEQIRSRMGLTPDNYQRDVLSLVHNFAEFVQLLPASESHHHAQPGGLLVHSRNALPQPSACARATNSRSAPHPRSKSGSLRCGPMASWWRRCCMTWANPSRTS